MIWASFGDTFPASISGRFFWRILSDFGPKMEPSGHPESVQTRMKKWLFYHRASFWGSWNVLALIWYPFGVLWVTSGCFFGAISWHLRLALAWFGIILRPFLSKLVCPESGHEFTRGFRQSLVIFHRASWYLIKLLGNLVFRKSSWVFSPSSQNYDC